MERLQKYMSRCGVASRRKSEELITDGNVSVDGKIVKELGYKINGNEEILVNGLKIVASTKEYYLLYKPEGTISSTKDEKNRINVIDLVETKSRVYPIGRLDYDTSGILLLTNDGELTNKLTHPSFDVEKEYLVKLNGIISGESINKLKNGIPLDGRKTKNAKIKVKKIDKINKKSYVQITITEGRNHQVKNMFKYCGYEVLKLKRIRYGFLTLEGLKKGEYRTLNIKEVKKLYLL